MVCSRNITRSSRLDLHELVRRQSLSEIILAYSNAERNLPRDNVHGDSETAVWIERAEVRVFLILLSSSIGFQVYFLSRCNRSASAVR